MLNTFKTTPLLTPLLMTAMGTSSATPYIRNHVSREPQSFKQEKTVTKSTSTSIYDIMRAVEFQTMQTMHGLGWIMKAAIRRLPAKKMLFQETSWINSGLA